MRDPQKPEKATGPRHKISLLASGGALLAFSLLAGGVPPALALIKGTCADCHTMHNSQNGAAMATFGGGSQANAMLTRGSCVGCHAQNGNEKIVTFGGNQFPQVMHTDGTGDLAGGNFAYITGAKGSGASQNKGHNVIDVVSQDSRPGVYVPPGQIFMGGHSTGQVMNSTQLTCAGGNGCHGLRGHSSQRPSGVMGLKGAHHGNVDGLLNTAVTLPTSYRFLMGVRGLENPNPTDRWQNKSSSSHNEYSGVGTPGVITGDCSHCHEDFPSFAPDFVRPNNKTISGFCATCHGNFHTLTVFVFGNDHSGIGATTSSPFIRHPTDIVIKNSGEYQYYTSYNLTAPVGRQALGATPSATVTPGSDTVTCLSCHLAHASDYPSMLRFDYSGMMAHNGSSSTGCFACHTSKDD